MKRLIRKADENDEAISNIKRMIYWWVDGSFHFQNGDRQFVAGERFAEDIEKALELYPEVIYNGTCYRFVVINGNEIGNYVEGLTYHSDNDTFTRDKSIFNVDLSESSKASIKQDLIKGYGIYQAFSKNANFEWGYGGGAHLAIKITLNNANGLDLNKIAEIFNYKEHVTESDNEVVAKLREDIDIELVRISGLID